MHLIAAEDRTSVTCSLSPGQAPDAPEGRKLFQRLGVQREPLPLVMNRAYEGNATRQLALRLGFAPVGPPRKTRRAPWEDVQAAQRSRAAGPAAEGGSSHLLSIREARRHLPRLHRGCSHLRCTTLV